MDVASPLLVVGLADPCNFLIYDLRKPDTVLFLYSSTVIRQVFKTIASKLKKQSRCVAAFPDKSGFAIGSIEGRVSIQHIEDKLATDKDFAFKCHRETTNIFSVHCIKFHQQQGSFCTVGGDGVINFWDKDSKQRLKAFEKMPGPITSAAFSPDGNIFVYSVGYDWAKGIADASKYTPNIWMSVVQENDVKLRAKTTTGFKKQ